MKIDPTLKALADPTRLRIMRLLAHMELAVGELAQVLEQSQPRVSRHVRILCDAALAERRREGSGVFLRIAIGEGLAPPIGAAVARLLAAAEADDAAFSARCAEDRRVERLGTRTGKDDFTWGGTDTGGNLFAGGFDRDACLECGVMQTAGITDVAHHRIGDGGRDVGPDGGVRRVVEVRHSCTTQ